MSRRMVQILFLIAFSTFIVGSYWQLPYSNLIMAVSGVICFVFALYEALRPAPREKR